MSANVRTGAFNIDEGLIPWWIGGSEDHGQANLVHGMQNAKEMIVKSGLDYDVEKMPLYVNLGGVFTEVPGRFSIVRKNNDGTNEVGTPFADVAVGSGYEPIPNREIFDACDIIVNSPLGRHYETAGCLNDGKTVWMLLRLNRDFFLADDAVRTYLLATTAHDGTSALVLKLTNTRVVCNNTLSFALGQVQQTFSIRHTKNYREKLSEAQKVLQMVPESQKAFEDFAKSMLAKKIDKETYNKLSEILFPFPEDGTDRQLQNVNKHRTLLAKAIIMPDLEAVRFTAWGALNAVADLEQHFMPVKGAKTTDAKLARIFERSFDTTALLRKAQSFLQEVTV